jgi:hypothetical protein
MSSLLPHLVEVQERAGGLHTMLDRVSQLEQSLVEARASLACGVASLQTALESLAVAFSGGEGLELARSLDPSGALEKACGMGSTEWRLGRLLATLALHARPLKQQAAPTGTSGSNSGNSNSNSSSSSSSDNSSSSNIISSSNSKLSSPRAPYSASRRQKNSPQGSPLSISKRPAQYIVLRPPGSGGSGATEPPALAVTAQPLCSRELPAAERDAVLLLDASASAAQPRCPRELPAAERYTALLLDASASEAPLCGASDPRAVCTALAATALSLSAALAGLGQGGEAAPAAAQDPIGVLASALVVAQSAPGSASGGRGHLGRAFTSWQDAHPTLPEGVVGSGAASLLQDTLHRGRRTAEQEVQNLAQLAQSVAELQRALLLDSSAEGGAGKK